MSDESPDGALPTDDERLEALIHRADLDGLVELVDARTEQRDWDGLARARRLSRQAITTGRQLWPIATLAEYRLALLAPAPQAAAIVNDDDAGRFTIGPLTEVVAQHHRWAELASALHGPVAALAAHERVLRGDTVDVTTVDGPNVLDLPFALAGFEPAYITATYDDTGVSADPPPLPQRAAITHVTVAADTVNDSTIDGGDVDRAVRALFEQWAVASDATITTAVVDGTAADAIAVVLPGHDVPTGHDVLLAPLTRVEALAWLAWGGAAGGANARRRGAAAGRFGALWTLAALLGATDEWPLPLDELGADSEHLEWHWWRPAMAADGWTVRLAVADPDEGVAWAWSVVDQERRAVSGGDRGARRW